MTRCLAITLAALGLDLSVCSAYLHLFFSFLLPARCMASQMVHLVGLAADFIFAPLSAAKRMEAQFPQHRPATCRCGVIALASLLRWAGVWTSSMAHGSLPGWWRACRGCLDSGRRRDKLRLVQRAGMPGSPGPLPPLSCFDLGLHGRREALWLWALGSLGEFGILLRGLLVTYENWDITRPS